MNFKYEVGQWWLPDCGSMRPRKVLHVHGTYVTCVHDNGWHEEVYTWRQYDVDFPATCGSPKLRWQVEHGDWSYDSVRSAWIEKDGGGIHFLSEARVVR